MTRGALLVIVALAGCNQLLGLDPVSERDGGAAPTDGNGDRDGTTSDATDLDAPPPFECGNGVIEPGEECDDGNANNGDGCSTGCKRELLVLGCADGVREGFPLETFAAIAACGGTWSTPGFATTRSGAGDCGNDGGSNGCNMLDLCAEGWHVCADRFEIIARLGGQPCTDADGFYATYQVGTAKSCLAGAGRIVYGCGSMGAASIGCSPIPLNVGAGCNAVNGWSCDGDDESTTLMHVGGSGGVLCCK